MQALTDTCPHDGVGARIRILPKRSDSFDAYDCEGQPLDSRQELKRQPVMMLRSHLGALIGAGGLWTADLNRIR